MPRSVPASIKPELLVWARVSAGFLSLERVAELTGFHLLTLEEWETGHELPTIGELRKLAALYKRPIAVFFLNEPPTRFDAQREFRRLAGTLPGMGSSELLLALRWAVFRRDAALELHRLTGERRGSLGASLQPDMDAEEAGRKIRELLGVGWEEQLEWSSAYTALNSWRSAMEAKGVLVFQTSDVALEEMRATCIPDQPLPVILLNAKDAPHGRVFSLVHEFAHILLRAGGHQTSRMVGERSPEEQPLEVAANAFAAAALLPGDRFRQLASRDQAAVQGGDSALRSLAERLKVSPEVILRRLTTLGLSTEGIYRRKRDEWGSRLWYIRPPSKGGPSVAVKTIAKDGPAYTRVVLEAYDQRIINTSAASDYLGAKPRHFSDIRQELRLRPAELDA